MYQATLRRLDFGFDREKHELVFAGQMDDGSGFRIGFPIEHVTAVFDQEASSMGYCGAVEIGDAATIDGFSRRVNYAQRAGYGNAYNRAIDRVGRQAVHYGLYGREYLRQNPDYYSGYYPDYAADYDPDSDNGELGSFWHDVGRVFSAPLRGGETLARSKAFGGVLGGVAVVFPAVGAPALAAWGAAHQTMAIVDAHKRGQRTGLPQLRINLQQLGNSDSPLARNLFAALASVPGDINETLSKAQALLAEAQAREAGAEHQTYSAGIGPVRATIGAPLPPAPPTGSTRTYVAPPTGRSYVAPPAPPTGSTRTYVAPPTGRNYVAPPAPPTRNYVAPPTGGWRPAPPPAQNTYWRNTRQGVGWRPAPPAQRSWGNWYNPTSYTSYAPTVPTAPIATPTWSQAVAQGGGYNSAGVWVPPAPPPPTGVTAPVAPTQYDPRYPYGRGHHRRHQYPAYAPQAQPTSFNRGYFQ